MCWSYCKVGQATVGRPTARMIFSYQQLRLTEYSTLGTIERFPIAASRSDRCRCRRRAIERDENAFSNAKLTDNSKRWITRFVRR